VKVSDNENDLLATIEHQGQKYMNRLTSSGRPDLVKAEHWRCDDEILAILVL
jgi:hypothetical protein